MIAAASTYAGGKVPMTTSLREYNMPTSLTRCDLLDVAHLGCQAQLKDVIFNVIVNYSELTQQIEKYLRLDCNNRPLKIVYDESQGSQHWATLEIIAKSKKAYYINKNGGVPEEIKKIFYNLGEDAPESKLFRTCDDYGIMALHYALECNCEEICTCSLNQLREKYEKLIDIMSITRAKVSTLLELVMSYSNSLAGFTYESACIFILFLETLALQNNVSIKYKAELMNIFELKAWDVEHLMNVRTKTLVHRKTSLKINPEHLSALFIHDQFSVQDFFHKLKIYLQYIKDKINYCDLAADVNVISPCSYLKGTVEAVGIQVSPEEMFVEVESYLRNVLKESFKYGRCNFDDEQKFKFNLIINFAPFSIPKNKCPKTLKHLQFLRNLHMHDFYKASNDDHMFLNYLRENKNSLFKCFYARDVLRLVKDLIANVNNRHIRDDILEKLSESLEKFKQEIEGEITVLAHPSIKQYIKILLVLADENSIQLRKENRRNSCTSTRYDQLSIGDTMHIGIELMKLKKFKMDDLNEYHNRLAMLERSWDADYDISKNDFKILIDLIVDDEDIGVNDTLLERIKNDVSLLTSELKCPINDKFTVNSILKKYKQRGNLTPTFTKGSFEEKLYFLPAGEKTKVLLYTENEAILDTDKFVATIFEIQCNESHRPKMYCTVQEAFEDPIFLDYLEAAELPFLKLLDKETTDRLQAAVPYVAPLLARIIVTNIKAWKQSLNHVLPLLEKISIIHVVKLLKYANETGVYFSRIWRTFWDRIKEPNFAFEFIGVIFEDNNHQLIIQVVLQCIKQIKEAQNYQEEKETRIIVWKMFQCFETEVVKKLFMDGYQGALDMLFEPNEIENIDSKSKKVAPEVFWRLKLIEAKIKWHVSELNKKRLDRNEYETYLDQSFDILTQLELYWTNNINFDHFGEHYFIALNYLSKALHSKGNHDKAYETITKLENKFVQYISGEDFEPTVSWTYQIYKDICTSGKYLNITENLQTSTAKYIDINNYLSIFRIRNNGSYYLHNKGVRNNAVADSKEALNRLKEVLYVLEKLGGNYLNRERIRTKKTLCRVYWDLGKVEKMLYPKQAVEYITKSLKLATDLVESQKTIFYDFHPAVIKYTYYAICCYNGIAELNTFISDQEKIDIYNRFIGFSKDHENKMKRLQEPQRDYFRYCVRNINFKLKLISKTDRWFPLGNFWGIRDLLSSFCIKRMD